MTSKTKHRKRVHSRHHPNQGPRKTQAKKVPTVRGGISQEKKMGDYEKQRQQRLAEYRKQQEQKLTNHDVLLQNIKKNLPTLKKLYQEACGGWSYEDRIYRYYHHSFKVYGLQDLTSEMSKALADLAPSGCEVNEDFVDIVAEGSDKEFRISHNRAWGYYVRPILEAFFHAKFFLEMAIKYGEELEKAPDLLPSGWAALLYFYNLRY